MSVATTLEIPPNALVSRDELDEVTLARARGGDRRALRALIERYERPVFALLGRMLGADAPTVVEDLAQETFLRVCRALSQFVPGTRARLSTWILTVATRLAIDELRRRRRPVVLMAELPDSPDRRPDPEVSAAGDEVRAVLAQAATQLSADQRAAFVLRVFHGRSYAEIAVALEVDVGTVKSRISRARATLRRALEDA